MPKETLVNIIVSHLLILLGLSMAVFTVQGCKKDAPTEAGNNQIPNPPSDLRAYGITMDRMQLSWTDNSSNEMGFRLERSAAGGTSFQLIASVGPNTVSHIDSGLKPSTTYNYRVSAFNDAGVSAPSNVLPVSTEASLASVFPATVGKVWQYSVDQEYGFISYYGSSNTHFQGKRVLYVDRSVSMAGRDAFRIYAFTRGLTADTTFNVETIYLCPGPSVLEKYRGSSWTPILSASSASLTNFTFLFAPGPSNSGSALRSVAQVIVPAGTYTATLTEHHFKENGQYASHHIYEDQWEYYADGVGLAKSKWNFSDDDKDPMGADMWNRGTISLESGIPAVLKETEPNDSALFNFTNMNSLPSVAMGDIDLADPGQVVNYRTVNPNKNNVKIINDWYRFYIDASREVVINLVFDGATNDVDLYLFKVNSGGSPPFLSQAESYRPAGCRELIDANLSGPEYYLIGLQAWDTPTTRANYWLSVK